MYLDYASIKNIIIVEIVLTIFVVISVYILKLFYFLKKRRDLRIAEQVKNYLNSIVAVPTRFSPDEFRNRWKRLDVVLPIVEKIKLTSADFFATTGKEIVRTVLLPIARRKTRSKKWFNRLLAARCFQLFMENHDEEFVTSLLKDSIPLVNLYAGFAAIKYGSKKLQQLVIHNMSKKRRLAQNIYLKGFETAEPHTRMFVEEYLKNEQDPFVRTTCYKILSLYPPAEIPLDLNADIASENIELRLAALRFMVYSQKEKAVSLVPLLTKLLSDKSWEIRAASIRLLGDLHAVQSTPEIAQYLHDPAWWVRMNVARTLHSFGAEGVAILKAQDPGFDLYAYETAMHVLQHQPSISEVS